MVTYPFILITRVPVLYDRLKTKIIKGFWCDSFKRKNKLNDVFSEKPKTAGKLWAMNKVRRIIQMREVLN